MARGIAVAGVAALMLSACASADVEAWKLSRLEADKAFALTGFAEANASQCLEDARERLERGQTLALEGRFRFDEALTRAVYDQLYWQGEGAPRRGVSFTAPATLGYGDGYAAKAVLSCHFSVTDDRLDFLSAQLLPDAGMLAFAAAR